MRYPTEFIEQLRARASVSDVVSRHVQLRRAGRELTGLCPFHKEKTPSFTVNDEKGFYHCFGCGVHGDAIGFIKEYENISYKEAIERLANDVGLPLPKMSREVVEKERKIISLQEVSELACQWFQQQLFSDIGRDARKYLHERGVDEALIEQFRLGYAPADRHGLERALKEKDVSPQLLVQAGLNILVDGKEPYARFRDRVMFPIRNRRGQVVAFGGRLLRPDPNGRAPKYLNSPETDLFHKGHMLYNLDIAQRGVRDGAQLVIAEGYTDVIALHQEGIPAVAPLGTALTADQLALLWRVVDVPVLCLDGDNAGQRAMDRAMNVALPMLVPGKSLNILSLPAGEDPDTLLKFENGAQMMRDYIASSRDIADQLWAGKEGAFSGAPSVRAGAEKALMQAAESIQDPQMKSHMRQYFKEKIFQNSRISYQGNNNKKQYNKEKISPSAAFKKEKDKSEVLNALLAKKSNVGDAAAMQLLACVCTFPVLLLREDVEELLASVSFENKDAYHVQQECFNLLANEPSDAIETMTYFEFEKRCSSVKALFSQQNAHRRNTSLAPYLIWRQAANAYTLQLVMTELQVAQASMAKEMSEESMQYFQALTEQKQMLENEQNILMEEQLASGEG